ncbi:flagellin N-terminal helical domain-containing protein [Limimaricola litoreus]|uniref:Flagellin n=1 Tax=Limimaricola litoreus TaxID=2955316 RepID=A0A9X2FVJ6_9RHOB|nr:flagellin [Limimaricola litoreus]MCP1169236.1 flagellin [Limimaricola litoreus]
MSSILTNNSAMSALSTLRNINNNLSSTQDRISSGLKVSSAKDNASYFSISKTMSAESGMNKSINEGLTLAKNSVSTARLGAETVTELATQFVDRLAFAQETGVDQDKIQKELDSLAAQMKTAIDQSSFNGENLLETAATGKTIISGASGAGGTTAVTKITLADVDLEAMHTAMAAIAIDNSTDEAGLKAALDAASAQLTVAVSAATDLGITEKAIETQQDFLSELTNRLDSGVGSIVDANMEEEAARLQSLQVQQQLSTQALSIANQAPQNILSLFR